MAAHLFQQSLQVLGLEELCDRRPLNQDREGHTLMLKSHIEYQLRIQVDDSGYNFKNYHHRSADRGGAWNLRVGRQFAAITREDCMYAQDLLTVDLSVGGDGFQAMAYGVWNWQAVGTAQSTWGFLAQAGYFIFEPWEVYAQYSLVSPGRIAGLIPGDPSACDRMASFVAHPLLDDAVLLWEASRPRCP